MGDEIFEFRRLRIKNLGDDINILGDEILFRRPSFYLGRRNLFLGDDFFFRCLGGNLGDDFFSLGDEKKNRRPVFFFSSPKNHFLVVRIDSTYMSKQREKEIR